MGKYRRAGIEGYGSEYEDENNNLYKPDKQLGKGAFCKARLLVTSKNEESKVVLSPLTLGANAEEATVKRDFFQTLYPDRASELFQFNNSYRLILPLLPGTEYFHIEAGNYLGQIKLFLSAIEALQYCHTKEYIFLDLKVDNILYDKQTGKSYLIDGGSAVKKGGYLPTRFRFPTIEAVEKARLNHSHYAPECFSLNKVQADYSMDVYSLGDLMKTMFHLDEKSKNTERLHVLIEQCQSKIPDDRPTLDELANELKLIYQHHNAEMTRKRISLARKNILAVVETIKDLKVSFAHLTTMDEINLRKEELKHTLHELTSLNPLLQTSCKQLEINSSPIIEQAMRDKNQEIKDGCELQNQLVKILIDSRFESHLAIFAEKLRVMHEKQRTNDSYCQAATKIKCLYEHLLAAKFSLLRADKPLNQLKAEFKETCLSAVDEVKVSLEAHREWQGILRKFFIDLIAALSGNINRWRMFSKTDSAKKLADLQVSIQLL
ncbi:protein kinase domain-containing protein [Legionella jordanis]|uniref:Protein kinase n=1 Tax=Legionella jordanis TaxID=456 RepID=A0A0W0VD11_9GAMM|nr:serine/threonine-protein kinase [Legionella jordanis]KTD18020.1 protein kinase [Legionella jordanis]RMX02293.1 hypothetical protein EAW55_08515 [Legionella jordanis]RMX21222.1 hypothetical protein EAS68_03355 [Legionella jordanis]VEH13888.1 protein kinase [Legionella jordanis]HAT8714270.1 hypothetical protein [Legionella jordanis]